jgi:hypothetical protein
MTSTTSTTTTSSVMPVTANINAQVSEEIEHPLEIIDVADKIFIKCLTHEDIRGIQALGCTSKPISKNIHSLKEEKCLVDTLYLQERFPDLRILDTNILPDLQVHEKFPISIFTLVKGQQDLNPHVEGDVGTSILIMRKGTTLNKMVDYAGSGQTEEEKMEIVFFPNNIPTELGVDAVEETHVVLITNNIFKNSRSKTYSQHCELVRDEHQCELPTALEYIGLIVLTRKIYNQCLYGQDPWTYGRSSTMFQGFPLVVGGSAPGRLSVGGFHGFDSGRYGAGSRRKF